jgi:tryptophanyl-tRNA synthetase
MRAVTGIQPSGQVHVGNWLGMIRPAIALQDRYETFTFVADWHALTSHPDPDVLRRGSREIAAIFLAFGLDPARGALFCQSDVPEVSELAWVLGTVVPTGFMDRGHAVKAARDGGRDPNAATWWYPLLMAADILLYGANVVPVGQDQKQHVEMARDMAIKMNVRFGDDLLVVPEVSIREGVGLVPGTDGRKMSKSYHNTVPVLDAPARVRKAVLSIKTDSTGVDEPKDPDACFVYQIYRLVARPDEVEEMARRLRGTGYGYGHAKLALVDALERDVAAPRERYEALLADPATLDDVLSAGATRARAAAAVTMERVRERVGLHPRRSGGRG